MSTDKVKYLLQMILRGITETDIEINIKETSDLIIVEIKPDCVTLTKWIIGKNGETIKAIRRIFETMSHTIKKKIHIEVL